MADKESSGMDFTTLAEASSQEKGSNSLTRLPDGFFERAVSFIKSSFAEIENTLSDGSVPDREAIRRSGENQRSREILESLYNTRERKVVLAALNASRGIDQRTENMTENEKDLFFNLKVELENKRDRVLRYDRMLSRPVTPKRETGIDTTTDDFSIDSRAHSPLRAASAKASTSQAANECELPRKVEADAQRTGVRTEPTNDSCLKGYRLVKALSDFGPFACGDGMSIRMAKNDIATLPDDIASVLVQQRMAQLMEGVP
jgi:DNA replication initiation complex subunit (GINS family)